MFQVDIIEKCKQNNRKAQLQLYNQYCQGMYIVANRFLKNADDAEDVVQEAFIKAFTKLHQYKAEVTFGAWLKSIVVNKSIDFLKSKKQQLVALNEVHLKVVDTYEDDKWLVDDAMTLNDVKKAMEALPEKYTLSEKEVKKVVKKGNNASQRLHHFNLSGEGRLLDLQARAISKKSTG